MKAETEKTEQWRTHDMEESRELATPMRILVNVKSRYSVILLGNEDGKMVA
jgi:hypothetical protein